MAPDPRIVASLRHLEAALDGGAATDMQDLFPEGFVFTHALVGLSWARVALMEVPPDVRAEALAAARRSARAIASDEGRAPFPADQNPPGGIFHAGWSALLAGQIVAADRDSTEAAAFQAACRRLGAAFDSTTFPPSYPGSAWPADAAAGIAALALHDRLLPPLYAEALARWTASVRERLDPETGLIAHAADARTGAPRGGARGESQALTLRLLAEADPAFARAQYRVFRRTFVAARLGLPVVLGYPAGFRGAADVDSGPLPLGVGLPATVVGLGTARGMGDAALAEPLDRELEALGLPVQWKGRRTYGFGAVPVGEAFLVWARLTPMAPASASFAPVAGAGWGFVLAVALVGILALVGALRLVRRRDSPARGS